MKIDLTMYKNKIVKHFKGNCYMIIDVAECTTTGDDLVIYRAIHDDCKLYARRLDEFISKVDAEKYPQFENQERFVLVNITDISND